MKRTEKEIIFHFDGVSECDFCGLMSFSHIHEVGSSPNQLEIIHEETPSSTYEDNVYAVLNVCICDGCEDAKPRLKEVIKDCRVNVFFQDKDGDLKPISELFKEKTCDYCDLRCNHDAPCHEHTPCKHKQLGEDVGDPAPKVSNSSGILNSSNQSKSGNSENSQEKAEKKYTYSRVCSQCQKVIQSKEPFQEILCSDHTPQPESEGVDRKTLENKLVKFYWTPCQDGKGNTDWDLVDGSEDFSIIPRNSKGKIQLEVGELRDIIHDAFDAISAAQAKQIRMEEGVVERMKCKDGLHCFDIRCTCGKEKTLERWKDYLRREERERAVKICEKYILNCSFREEILNSFQ